MWFCEVDSRQREGRKESNMSSFQFVCQVAMTTLAIWNVHDLIDPVDKPVSRKPNGWEKLISMGISIMLFYGAGVFDWISELIKCLS